MQLPSRTVAEFVVTTAPVTTFAELTGTVLADVGANSSLLQAGVARIDPRFGTASSLTKPTYVPAGTDFAAAVAAAAELSAPNRTSGSVNWSGNPNADNSTGSQPMAVVQAVDGAYAITPLVAWDFPEGTPVMHTAETREWLAREWPSRTDGRHDYGRAHIALQAVVGADQWVDMRDVPVGQSAWSVDLLG
jgi:hypothetical protein